jgi:DNA polymerase-4
MPFAIYLQKNMSFYVPCSIGIGTKNYSKIASIVITKGILTLTVLRERVLQISARTIPGVGKVTIKHFNEKGFYKIKDITSIPKEYFSVTFGKSGIDIWEKANGHGNNILSISHTRKSLSKETTFDTDVTDKNKLQQTLFELSGKVCQLLRDGDWVACTITLKLRYTDFVTVTRAKTLKYATDSDDIIYSTILRLFKTEYTRRVGVRLLGVALSNLREYAEQDTIFEDAETMRKRMYRAVSKIRDKFGFDSITVGKF